MGILLPKLKTNRGNIGNELWIHLPDLSGFEKTYLSGDEALAQTTINVLQGTNFSANEFVIIGIPGTSQAEILKVSSVTATTIVLASGLAYTHNKGTLITFIPFDSIEIYSASASGGTFSLLTTLLITPDSLETFYADTTAVNTIYYKARFKNSNDTTYSDYSDEVAATGFAYNSVWSIKNRALSQLGESIGNIITDSFLNESLWEARREVDELRKRWSFRTSFDTIVTSLTEGQYSFTVPTTLRNPDSPQNILGLRIGSTGREISYIDKREMDNYYEGIIHTTIAAQPSIGQVTLVLTDVGDLDSAGSVKVGVDTITYTSKSNSTNTLSGIPASGTGSITVAHIVGTDTWQNIDFGEPIEYNIYEDTIFFNTPVDSTFEGDNIIMDFYRTLPDYNSDADILDEPNADMFVSYLKAMIKNKKEKGKLSLAKDSDYQNYIIRRSTMIKNEFLHQGIAFIPAVPSGE